MGASDGANNPIGVNGRRQRVDLPGRILSERPEGADREFSSGRSGRIDPDRQGLVGAAWQDAV